MTIGKIFHTSHTKTYFSVSDFVSPSNTARPKRRNPKIENLNIELSLFPGDGKLQLKKVKVNLTSDCWNGYK